MLFIAVAGQLVQVKGVYKLLGHRVYNVVIEEVELLSALISLSGDKRGLFILRRYLPVLRDKDGVNTNQTHLLACLELELCGLLLD